MVPLRWCTRILKPTKLSSIWSTLGVFLKQKTRTTGLYGYFRSSSHVIWPHELFAGIFKHHPEAFEEHILGGGPNEVRKFWASMPCRAGMESKNNWHTHCIPLSLHGDGISIANIRGKATKTVDCLSWSSLLSSGPTRFTYYLIWFCYSHMAKTSGLATTWGSFWVKLCMSLRILWSGIWPEKTFNGEDHPLANQPLAGGYYAIIYTNKGDLDWMSHHFHLPHASSSYPCGLCQCSNVGPRDPMPWTDVNSRPSWLPSCWTDKAKRGPMKENAPIPKTHLQNFQALELHDFRLDWAILDPKQGKRPQSTKKECIIGPSALRLSWRSMTRSTLSSSLT